MLLLNEGEFVHFIMLFCGIVICFSPLNNENKFPNLIFTLPRTRMKRIENEDCVFDEGAYFFIYEGNIGNSEPCLPKKK